MVRSWSGTAYPYAKALLPCSVVECESLCFGRVVTAFRYLLVDGVEVGADLDVTECLLRQSENSGRSFRGNCHRCCVKEE